MQSRAGRTPTRKGRRISPEVVSSQWAGTDAVDSARASLPQSIALFHRGQRWVDGLQLQDQPSLLEHGRLLASLERSGHAIHADPVHRLDDVPWSDLIGVASFAVEVDVARSLLREDPALRSGLLTCEVIAWFVSGSAA